MSPISISSCERRKSRARTEAERAETLFPLRNDETARMRREAKPGARQLERKESNE